MKNFADRLIEAIKQKGNPCVVGLDPRMELIPRSFFEDSADKLKSEIIEDSIFAWSACIIDAVKDLVPAVKLQSAFYEQYGVPGMWAFARSANYAKAAGLIVIADAKRNDIGSTAEAYANAFIGRSKIVDSTDPIFGFDSVTVSPYLGRDSLEPFADTCKKYGNGIFVLVKTSNAGSGDLQDLIVTRHTGMDTVQGASEACDQSVLNVHCGSKRASNEEMCHSCMSGKPVYEYMAEKVNKLGNKHLGESGYSSIGAVVGATYPEEAKKLRKLMPKTIFLVPGYGAQGGKAEDVVPCFNEDGLGAIVNSSRAITYSHSASADLSQEDYADMVRENTQKMIADINRVLKK